MKSLFQFDKNLKILLIAFLISLTTGVLTGIIYLNYTTNLSSKGAIERFRGTEEKLIEDEFDIPESYAKTVSEMLITTHNHVIGFSLIFLSVGLIFYFNSIINGFWKKFLIIEPFFSTVISFGSLWLVRFAGKDFIYLTIISALMIYLSYFVMVSIALYDLIFKKQ